MTRIEKQEIDDLIKKLDDQKADLEKGRRNPMGFPERKDKKIYLDEKKGADYVQSKLDANGIGSYTKAAEPPFKAKESRLVAELNETQFAKEVAQNASSQALGFFTTNEYDLAAVVCTTGAFQAYEKEIRSPTFFKPCRTPSYWSYENLSSVIRTVELVHMIMDEIVDHSSLLQCGEGTEKLKEIIQAMSSYCNGFMIESYTIHIKKSSTPLEILQIFTKYFSLTQKEIMSDFNVDYLMVINFYCAFYAKICKILYKFNAYYLNKKIKGSFGNKDFNRVFSGIKGTSKERQIEELGAYITTEGLQDVPTAKTSKLNENTIKASTTNNAKKYVYLAMQALDVFLPLKLIPDSVIIYDRIMHLVMTRTHATLFECLRKMCYSIRIPFVSMFSKIIFVEEDSNNGIFKKIIFKPVKEKNITTYNNISVAKGFVYKFFKTKLTRNYVSQLVARDLTKFIHLYVIKSAPEGPPTYEKMDSRGINPDHNQNVLKILNDSLKELKLTVDDLKV